MTAVLQIRHFHRVSADEPGEALVALDLVHRLILTQCETMSRKSDDSDILSNKKLFIYLIFTNIGFRRYRFVIARAAGADYIRSGEH
jgi:hypothetical protein